MIGRPRGTTVIAVTCALVALAACARNDEAYAYSGTVQAPSAAVGSTLGGRVVAVLVSDGAPVRRGQLIVRFDDVQARAAVTSAEGRLAQARATLADLNAGTRAPDLAHAQALANQQLAMYRTAARSSPHQLAILRAQLREAQAQAADAAAANRQAQADAHRTRSLYATGDTSAQERDAADARAARATAQVKNTQAAVRAARIQLANAAGVTLPQNTSAALAGYRAAEQTYRSLAAGPRPDQVRAAGAAVRATEGDLAAARQRLAEAAVRAPAAGTVTALDLHPGDLVAGGAAVSTIEERGEPYVRIYVPQSQLGRVRVGARVSVRSDADPAARFPGSVEQIDAEAQFTPQSVQTAGDRATLAFGVKVRLHAPQGRLHGGTTVEVALP